jgi:hypothetical protein
MLLVQIGIIILLINVDVIDADAFLDLLLWFPIFLIAVGVEKVFTRSRMELIAYATTVCLMAGGLWIVFDASAGPDGSSFFSRTSFSEKLDPEAREIFAEMEIDDAEVTVRDATDALVYARFAEFTPKPRVSYDLDEEGVARLKFSSRAGRQWSHIIHYEDGYRYDWSVKFSESLPLTLECYGEDADLHLNFATTPLRNLKLDAENTDVYLKIGDIESEVTVAIFGVDSEVKLRVPRESGLRISGRDFAALLARVGLVELADGIFVSEGYDTSSQRINVDLDERLKSLSIDTY